MRSLRLQNRPGPPISCPLIFDGKLPLAKQFNIYYHNAMDIQKVGQSGERDVNGIVVPPGASDAVQDLKDQQFVQKYTNRAKRGEFRTFGLNETENPPGMNREQRRKQQKIERGILKEDIKRIKAMQEETYFDGEYVDKIDTICHFLKDRYGRFPTRSETLKILVDLYYDLILEELEAKKPTEESAVMDNIMGEQEEKPEENKDEKVVRKPMSELFND